MPNTCTSHYKTLKYLGFFHFMFDLNFALSFEILILYMSMAQTNNVGPTFFSYKKKLISFKFQVLLDYFYYSKCRS